MRAVLLALAAVALTGCATRFHGQKQGAGQKEFSNDFLECRALARRLTGSEDNNTIETCMKGKGWTIKTESKLQLF